MHIFEDNEDVRAEVEDDKVEVVEEVDTVDTR